jgi:2-iminobutanoate/2-iminopropanoate deaminase
MRVPLSKIQANWPSSDAILHRDERGRTSLRQRDAARRWNGEPAMPRSSIYVGEIAHQSPIPNASRIGNIIVSGLIRGADPATSRLAATLEQQCAFMFLHMRQVVEAGGATVEDIIKVTVWMKELNRKPVNDEWVKMFPDPASRPARQIMEVPMEAGVLVQCDFIAVIEA